MAQITIGSNQYDAYCDVAYADGYMAADAALYSAWAEFDADAKGRAIISASRYLAGLCWAAGDPPGYTDVDGDIQEACAVLAAMVASEPNLITGSAGAVNGQSGTQDVRRAQAGSAEVEFFDPLRSSVSRQEQSYGSAASLPGRVRAILNRNDLLCQGKTRYGPYNGGKNKERCPDSCENGFSEPLT